MSDEKEILKKLLVDEKDVVKALVSTVDKAKDVFVIEKSSGKVIFKDFGNLTDHQRVCALLIGRYFALKLNLLDDSALGTSEIADELGRSKKSISGRIAELSGKGFIERLSNRKYIIARHRIQEIFDTYFGGKKHG